MPTDKRPPVFTVRKNSVYSILEPKIFDPIAVSRLDQKKTPQRTLRLCGQSKRLFIPLADLIDSSLATDLQAEAAVHAG
jgi:hypothetical protein